MVLRAHYRTTARCQHGFGLASHLVKNRRFPLTKPVLTFYIENPWNICPTALLDNPVRIKKTITELSGKQPADSAFSGPPGPSQSDVFGQTHTFRPPNVPAGENSAGRAHPEPCAGQDTKKPPGLAAGSLPKSRYWLRSFVMIFGVMKIN